MARIRRLLAALAVVSLATACGSPPEPAAPGAPAVTTTAPPPVRTIPPSTVACEDTASWDTGPQEGAGATTDALYLVRAGRNTCFDRVVFDINGPAPVGFSVRYVPEVSADGSGTPIPVAGGAALEVVVRAPAQGADESGHQPGRLLAATGDYFYAESQLAGWPSLRAVRFAGFFEGQCTFAVGVRAQLPFRAFTLLDTPDRIRRVVVDIAH